MNPMYSYLTKLLFIVFATLVVTSCKLAEKVTEPAVAPMPGHYQPGNDTTQNASILLWRDYFNDPYLVGYIDEAIKNNLDLKRALQRVSMAGANLRMARGAFLPTLNAVTAISQQKFGEYTIDGIGNFDTNLSDNVGEDKRIPVHLPDYYVGFQSSWEIDVWGKLRNRKKAAGARFIAFERAWHLVKTILVAEVARHYFSLLALDDKLTIIRENVRLQETAVNLIRAQKDAGRATELAVKQFTAQLLNTQSLEALIEQEIVRHENELNLMLARYPQPIARGQSILQQALPNEIQTGLPAQLLVQRPDIQQAELQLIAARLDVNAARAAFLPSITLTSGLGMQAFNTEVLFTAPASVAYSVLGGLIAPLFNRNMIQAEYHRAAANQLELVYTYQQTILNGFQEVATQLSKIDNLEKSYRFKAEEVSTLMEGVATSNDLFIAGLASYLEVVTAQKSVLLAELDAIDTRQQQFNATIDLYRALGGGWQ